MGTYTKSYKLVVIGDNCAGKTSLANRLINDEYTSNYIPSLNTVPMTKDINYDNKQYRLTIYDDFVPSKFSSISCNYTTTGTHAFLLCLDLSDLSAIDQADNVLNSIKNIGDRSVILLGTKSDLDKAVSETNIESFKKQHNINTYYETSAKNGTGLENILPNLVAALTLNEKTCKVTTPKTPLFSTEDPKPQCPGCIIL